MYMFYSSNNYCVQIHVCAPNSSSVKLHTNDVSVLHKQLDEKRVTKLTVHRRHRRMNPALAHFCPRVLSRRQTMNQAQLGDIVLHASLPVEAQKAVPNYCAGIDVEIHFVTFHTV